MKRIIFLVVILFLAVCLNAQDMARRFFLDSDNITKLAEEGNGEAQYAVGFDYYIGLVNNQDYETAMKWFRKSADNNYPEAFVRLGLCYYAGKGVDKNVAEALKNGAMASKTYLGMMYYYGQGVEKDTSKAFKMLSEAVEEKSVLSAKAMRVLSACYRYGLGTEKK